MAERVKMLHCITGATMLVPAEQVARYVEAGHIVAVKEDGKKADKPKTKK